MCQTNTQRHTQTHRHTPSLKEKPDSTLKGSVFFFLLPVSPFDHIQRRRSACLGGVKSAPFKQYGRAHRRRRDLLTQPAEHLRAEAAAGGVYREKNTGAVWFLLKIGERLLYGKSTGRASCLRRGRTNLNSSRRHDVRSRAAPRGAKVTGACVKGEQTRHHPRRRPRHTPCRC